MVLLLYKNKANHSIQHKKKQSHFNAAEIQVSLVRRIKELQQPCLSITWCGNCCISFLAVRRISPNYSYHHNIFYKIPFEINVVDPEIPVSFSVKISFRGKVDGASCTTQTRNFSSTVWLLSSDSSWFWLTLQETKATVIAWGGVDRPSSFEAAASKEMMCHQGRTHYRLGEQNTLNAHKQLTKRWQPHLVGDIRYFCTISRWHQVVLILLVGDIK